MTEFLEALNLSRCGAVFLFGYFASYFLTAWLDPNRSSVFWVDWKHFIRKEFEFRTVIAMAMTVVYVLWTAP